MRRTNISTSRRNALALSGAAAFIALSGPQRAGALSSIRTGGGLAGGGSVEVQGGGVADFSVFGSRFDIAGQSEPLVFGSLRWADSNGIEVSSTKIVDYGPTGSNPNARRIEGFATMNGQGEHPFTLTLFDESGPAKGADRIHLEVLPSQSGTATPEGTITPVAPIYSSDNALKSGDLQLLTFDFPG